MSEQPDSQSSTQPPRKKPLGFDEMIAILVAFGAIGSILFWGLTRQSEESAVNLDGLDGSFNPLIESPVAGLSSPLVGASAVTATPQPQRSIAAQRNIPTAVPSTLPSVPPNRTNGGNVRTILPAVVPAAGVIAGAASPASSAPEVSPTLSAPIAAVGSFPDVPADYWARPFVEGLAKRGITVGSPDGTFRPDQLVTRAEYAVLVQKAFEQQESQGAIAFTDVPADYWATPAIDAAVKQGFLKGYPDGSFQPNKQIPRFQVLLSLVNGLGLPRPDQPEEVVTLFQDRDQIPEWAVPAVGTAAESNIVVNHPNRDQLRPTQPITRAEAAALVYQALVASGKAESVPSEYIVKP